MAGHVELKNTEIVVLALFMLGGDINRVTTEHIAVRAAELSGLRFRWQHYPDQISLDRIQFALRDSKKASGGRMVKGTEKTGWMLTAEGITFASANVGRLASQSALGLMRQSAIRAQQADESRLLESDAFLKFLDDRRDQITRADFESFFRVNDYMPLARQQQKLQRIINGFGDHSQLGSVVEYLIDRYGSKE